MPVTEPPDDIDRTTLLTTPLVAASLPHLKEGADVTGGSIRQRRAGWASWMVRNLTVVNGHRRHYPALQLPGRFYDPHGKLSETHPHLELNPELLQRHDDNFTLRLAAAGNGLLNPWWVVSEATAAKRAICDTHRHLPEDIVTVFDREHAGLAQACQRTINQLNPVFDDIAETLATQPAALRDIVCDRADRDELGQFWYPAKRLGVTARLEPGLETKDGNWVARRAGAWVLAGSNWNVGVLAPRLTKSSFCHDTLWDPHRESGTALLIRALLAARLAHRYGVHVAKVRPPAPTGYLQVVPTRTGHTPAHASSSNAIRFLRSQNDAPSAWETLQGWTAKRPGRVLTVQRDAFIEAFIRARRALARGETPARADIDTVLPLVWHHDTLGRLTFVKDTKASSDT